MYPDLSYLFHDFFDIQSFTFGACLKIGLVYLIISVALFMLFKVVIDGLIVIVNSLISSIPKLSEASLNIVAAILALGLSFYITKNAIGTQPDNWLAIFKTFGFFLALSFVLSGLVYYVELKRKAQEGIFKPTRVRFIEGRPASMLDIIGNAVVGLIFFGKAGYAWAHFTEFRTDPASVVLSTKMNWLFALAGAALFGFTAWYDAWKKKKSEPSETIQDIYPHHRIFEVTAYAAIGGILGAKIFDLFDNWESFMRDPVGSLLSGGGLAFYGGLVLGAAAVIYYLWKHKIPFFHAADGAGLAVTAGYGFGRLGCQLSGDGDWGIVNNAVKPDWMGFLPDWTWAYKYPHHVLNMTYTDPVPSEAIEGCTWEYCMQLSQPVYPTPIYEVLMMSIVFGILWFLRKKLKTPGMLFGIYLILIAIERFIIEKIRVNVVHEWNGISFTQAELISVVLALFGLAFCIFVSKRHKKQGIAENA